MLTDPQTSDMATFVMEQYKGSIRQRGKDCWDIYVYYPPKKNVIRIAYDKRGERIRSKTEALDVLMEVNTQIRNNKFDSALYQKVSRLRFNTSITGI